MTNFNSARRDLLKLSGMGLAAAAVTLPSYASAPPAGTAAPLFFDIRTYGAIGDGKTLDTPAINKAIEAAAAAGGGTVYVPSGTWLCFSIHLKSHVHLYLAQGATILAADSPKPGEATGYNGGTYDAAEPKTSYDAYQDYGHNHWHNSLFWGEDLNDLSITGPGLIHGKGLSFGGDREPRGNYTKFIAEQPGVGNKTIALKNCRNVLFRDFGILKGGHFGLLLTGVDNLTIDNLTIDTDRDGIDIDCCRNVRVSNCSVNAPWDDAICPKSSFALGFARATENMTITNCIVSGSYVLGSVLDGSFKVYGPEVKVPRNGRIKCGTESNGGFKNITISNCVFEGCEGLALESSDGALCEDITISNLTMRNLVSAPLFFRLNARLRGPKESTHAGTLQRVFVDNVVSYNCDTRICSILSGVPEHLMQDIKLSNIYLQHKGGAPAEQLKVIPPELVAEYPDPGRFGPMPAQGLFLRNIRNLELSHVEVAAATPDPRPSFYLQNVHRADFIAVTAPTGIPAFTMNKSTDVRILLSRAAPDTTLATADNKTV
jgi:polygalacturonase